MRRTITTLLFLVAVALLVAGVTLPLAPPWLTAPGGLLALLAAAFVGITQLGEGLRAWRDLLFGNKTKPIQTLWDKSPHMSTLSTQGPEYAFRTNVS